jgi:hypothetical protein
MGLGLAAGLAGEDAKAEPPEAMTPPDGGDTLGALAVRLEKAPRRRDFKTVPMIVTEREFWDHEALSEVMAYKSGPKQAWDNTDIAGPWINGMRNSLNAQVFAFKRPNFFVVSATHGTAHLALLDQAMWDKYQLTKLAGDKFPTNTLIVERRGVVFLGCHNTMWEVSEKLVKAGVNPDKLSHEAMAAELTNNIVPGVVLTPGLVATLPELAAAGFSYVR